MTDQVQIKDRVEMTRPGEAYRTTCRLAAMAGETEIPAFVNYGKIYETRDGKFRIVSELGDRKNPLRCFLEMLA